MTMVMLLPLQGGNNKQFIRSPRALPWANGLLALRAVLILAFFFGTVIPLKAQSERAYTVRFALNGGWTIKTRNAPVSTPVSYRDYLETVKQGPCFGANTQLNIKDLFAVGLYFDYYNKSKMGSLSMIEDGQINYFTINNTYTINFLALSLGIQKTEGKNHYMLHYLIGLMNYKEVGNYSPYHAWVSNNTMGHCLGHGLMVNYDYMINDHLAFGAELTYCIGSVSKLSHQGHLGDPNDIITDTSQLDDPIRLDRLSAKAGISYYF